MAQAKWPVRTEDQGGGGPARRSSARVPGRGRRGHGFSLVELVLSIAIISILAAVTVPRFANANHRQRVKAAVRRVAADIEYVQRMARFTGTPLTITFDESRRKYTCNNVADPLHPASIYVVKLNESPYLIEEVTVTLPGAVAAFDAYGKATASGDIKLRTSDINESVHVDADSGRAYVQ